MNNWQRYLLYLVEWVESHQSTEFLGMSPASYNEWLDNEADEGE